MTRFFVTVLAAACAATGALAQDVWIQIAARPGAEATVAAAETYARRLDAVSAFALEGSRYGAIVLGPYDAAEVEGLRRALRARGQIPGDSYTTRGERFGRRLFPGPDAATATRDAPAADTPAPAEAGAGAETPAEARRAERRLSGAERRRLQTALAWAGHYDGAIDGAIGPGTRGAMSGWQRANGHAATGVMTTGQRRALLAAYEAVLEGLDMRRVEDARAGITVAMPTALVAFDHYAPPVAHYPARPGAEIPARVLLISQAGGRDELRGLYEVMQTLEIVPREGPRSRSADAFSLTGRDAEIVSTTEMRLADGHIKGFTLVWPAGDEPRRRRVMAAMRDSFRTDPGAVLPDAMDAAAGPGIDLLAGLEVRRPALTRSGFYVSPRGEVLTTADAVADCARITLDDGIAARVLRADDRTGMAVLAPERALAPRRHARLAPDAPRREARAILAGYSFGGQLPAPSLTEGRLADPRGLDDEDHLHRYALPARPGDAGGPVMDPGGAVLGMLAEPGVAGRSLPRGVALASDADAIADLLTAAGLSRPAAAAGDALTPDGLARLAADITVRVGCWR